MQNQGSIGPATVAQLLQTMQQDRATGTLSLESAGHQCALHFLFGHLFHAVSDGEEGEAAVLSALDWTSGEYTFNPRAKLPPEETINSSTEDLLSRWRGQTAEAASGPPVRPATTASFHPEKRAELVAAPPPATYQSFATNTEDRDDGDWLDSISGRPAAIPEEDMSDIPPFQTPMPQPTPPVMRSAVPTQPAGVGSPTPARTTAPNQSGTAAVRPPVRPVAPTAPPQKPVAGATRSQLSVLIPMPAGDALHSGLKASFLNFPMLLKTLSQDRFSGFVSVHGEGEDRGRGHILFRGGDVIQAQQRADGTYRRGKAALQEVARTVAQGHGLIDAVELPAELMASVASLIVAATAFVNLPARIVDFEALLEYIGDQRVSGGVLVSQGDQVAVALLTDGSVKGSYGSSVPELVDGAQVAATACAEREARIDVVAAPAQPLAALDLAEIG